MLSMYADAGQGFVEQHDAGGADHMACVSWRHNAVQTSHQASSQGDALIIRRMSGGLALSLVCL
jgi:hypothetical protein